MEIVLSSDFDQLSLIEKQTINGGKLQKGDFNKAAAAAAVSAVCCPELAPALLAASAGLWLADACAPDSIYGSSHSHSSASKSF